MSLLLHFGFRMLPARIVNDSENEELYKPFEVQTSERQKRAILFSTIF